MFQIDSLGVLSEFRDACIALLRATPGPTDSCQDVEKSLGVDAKLAWQVLRMGRATDPLGAGIGVPARVSMQKLLASAKRRRVPRETVERVATAFEGYERLVREHAGERSEFEAMIRAQLPAEREKQELASKQLVSKGISQIKGIVLEQHLSTGFFQPNADGRTLDGVVLSGYFGLRRLRQDVPLNISTGDLASPGSHSLDLGGHPVADFAATLLGSFCTSPLPDFRVFEAGGLKYRQLATSEIGMRSAADIVMADRRNAGRPRYFTAGGKTHTGVTYWDSYAARHATMDVFVHTDLFPGVVPELAIYDTSTDGTVRLFNDPTRVMDRLHMHEVIRPLPPGIAGARSAHIPRYMEMLEYVYGKTGWNPAEFRGYRLEIQYPLHSAEYMIGFKLPEMPA
ncbi:MAG: hypothetical protein ACREJO_00650 [Phycisphaerales bacterium]